MLKKKNTDKQKQVKLYSRIVSFKLKRNLLDCHQVYISSASRCNRRRRVTVVVVVGGGGDFVVVCYFIYSKLILFAQNISP
jgi:hypothetical protein